MSASAVPLIEIPKKLNLGCGDCKLEGYWNVDIDEGVKPDQVVNICGYLPYPNEYFETIIFMHTIEHIEKKYHEAMFAEIHRILSPTGNFVLGYPEFSVCLQYWLDNYLGKREFWEACIYGRQTTKSDFHVSAMHTPELKDMLTDLGFIDIFSTPEPTNPQYTVLKARRGTPLPTYEDHLREVVFG